ncbi:hypothetical protein EJB05_41965, partial [Eragrostis curvula]
MVASGLCYPVRFCLRSVYGPWIMARSFGVKGVKERGQPPVDYVTPKCIIDKTTHRDGSIYKKMPGFLKLFHITKRDETRLEPMMLSEPNTDCEPDQERCLRHGPSHMMQIFSLKLAQIPIGNNSVELYGYIAARDSRDSLLNYIVNLSSDDPIIMQQGSLIEMIGPKRGISMGACVLLEFDMRIKKGEQEEDDLQLIDGASDFSEFAPCRVITSRINGECGAVDITEALLYDAVEATIEVEISKAQNGFSLSLSSFVFIYGLHEEIQLFHGTIGEPCSLRRFVIAVEMDTWMHMKFKIGQKGCKNHIERYFSFKANNHGYKCQQVICDLASISAKVTWSTPLMLGVFSMPYDCERPQICYQSRALVEAIDGNPPPPQLESWQNTL